MKIFGNIEKVEDQDDGTVIVSGFASSEDVDCDGEIIKASAMSEALPDYMKFANIREMHQAKAAGVALDIAVQTDNRTWLKAHIVDSEAVKKIKAAVYKGFSIGGRVTGRDETNQKIITGIRLSEISLVDRPANPSAVFEMWKGENIEGDTMTDEEKKAAELARVEADKKAADDKVASDKAAAGKVAKELADKAIADKAAKKAEIITALRKYEGEEVQDAQMAMNALSCIYDLIFFEEGESEDEKAQIALLRVACDKLKAFIASELAEDNAPDAVTYAAQIDDLKKVQGEKETELTKAQGLIAEKDTALAKAADDLKKVTNELEALKKQAAPIKGVVKGVPVSVTKEQDSAGAGAPDKIEQIVRGAIEGGADAATALVKAIHSMPGIKISN